MKSIMLIAMLFLSIPVIKGQETAAAKRLAMHMAGKMTDSLGLNIEQKEMLVEINMDLARDKIQYYKKQGSKEDIQKELQRIESTRDRRYEKVLTPDQYVLYLQKKSNLVNANK